MKHFTATHGVSIDSLQIRFVLDPSTSRESGQTGHLDKVYRAELTDDEATALLAAPSSFLTEYGIREAP